MPLTKTFHKYFQLYEFDSPDQRGTAENMDIHFLNKLAAARDHAQIPFVITSGFRTFKHNQQLIAKGYKASPNSSHLKGLAADIQATTNYQRFVVIKSLCLAGFDRIGIGKNFIHVDADPDKVNNIAWLY